MGFAEYSNFDGLGLAELVKKKKVKPAELVEAAIERIERHKRLAEQVARFSGSITLANTVCGSSRAPMWDGDWKAQFHGRTVVVRQRPKVVRGSALLKITPGPRRSV